MAGEKEEEDERRLAEKMLRERMRQEARGIIAQAFEATRTSGYYEEPGEFVDNFPSSQTDLELEMLPILEEVLAEELKKRLGKRLPEEVTKAIALVLEHQDWD